ncbi:MAG: hypothetical protein JO075_06790 [Acidimicrobiia bacterium]|nr:hypothetical protein [Acidimicrobiia bacterium]
MPTHRRAVRVSIAIDVYDQSLLTVLIWARQSGHTLTTELWEHGVLAHLAHVEIDERRCTP